MLFDFHQIARLQIPEDGTLQSQSYQILRSNKLPYYLEYKTHSNLRYIQFLNVGFMKTKLK
jgi:hypothetical protein